MLFAIIKASATKVFVLASC